MVVRVLDGDNGKGSKKLWLEGNFTQVPSDILEALARTYLSPNESKIVLLIIRKTYGWHKRMDWISLSQIVEGTGIAQPNVCRSIKSLRGRRIILRPDSKHVGLQEDVGFWLHKNDIKTDNKCYQ
ncbi:replication protein [Chloroflexota bacterium]